MKAHNFATNVNASCVGYCAATGSYTKEAVTSKPKKSDLEDLQKAHAPMASALFEQHKIIFLKANTCNRSLFGKHG
jgi:hypothetical protein